MPQSRPILGVPRATIMAPNDALDRTSDKAPGVASPWWTARAAVPTQGQTWRNGP
jgi:hypothetical protein